MDFANIDRSVQGTVGLLEAKKTAPVYDNNFKKLVTNLRQNKINMEINEARGTAFDANVKVPFIEKLVKNTTDRFENNTVMQAFSHLSNRA